MVDYMALTLMYITNNPVTAQIAQNAGVDRIWIDMEYIGKDTRQGGMDTVKNHHTIEDIGIALGTCLKEALGDKRGIRRYGAFTIPMDEALVTTNLDISGRPFLVFNVDLTCERIGTFETEMTEEFFRAFAFNSLITLHINEQYGTNNHHIVEAIFKSLGRALKEAISIDESNKDKIVSSKGVL